MSVTSYLDIVAAREKGRWLAEAIGFEGSELTLVSTLISEVTRKVVALDCRGNVVIQTLQRGPRKGIAISIMENPIGGNERLLSGIGGLNLRERLSEDDRLLMLATKRVADEFDFRPLGRTGAVLRIVKWV